MSIAVDIEGMKTTLTLTMAMTGKQRKFNSAGEMYDAVCALHVATKRDIDTIRKSANSSYIYVRGALVGEFSRVTTIGNLFEVAA